MEHETNPSIKLWPVRTSICFTNFPSGCICKTHYIRWTGLTMHIEIINTEICTHITCSANVATGIAFKQSMPECTQYVCGTDIDLCATFFMLQILQFNMLHQNLVCSFSRDNIEFSCTNLIGIVSVCLFTLYYAPHCSPSYSIYVHIYIIDLHTSNTKFSNSKR